MSKQFEAPKAPFPTFRCRECTLVRVYADGQTCEECKLNNPQPAPASAPGRIGLVSIYGYPVGIFKESLALYHQSSGAQVKWFRPLTEEGLTGLGRNVFAHEVIFHEGRMFIEEKA